MKTQDLIAALAADIRPGPTVGQRLARALPLALAASGLAFAVVWGVRPGLAQVLASGLVAKTLVPALLATLALALVAALVRPAAPVFGRAVAVGGALAGLVLWLVARLWGGAPGDLAMAMAKPDLWVCLVSVPVLSIAPLAGLLWALRSGAAMRPALAGAVAGLAAGGLGAALYSLYCTVDMAVFVLPAYGTAVGLVALAGALAGSRLLAW